MTRSALARETCAVDRRAGRRRRQGRSRAPDGSTMRSRRDRSHEGCGRGRSRHLLVSARDIESSPSTIAPDTPRSTRAQALHRRVLEHRPSPPAPCPSPPPGCHQAHRQQRVDRPARRNRPAPQPAPLPSNALNTSPPASRPHRAAPRTPTPQPRPQPQAAPDGPACRRSKATGSIQHNQTEPCAPEADLPAIRGRPTDRTRACG